jgi:hypothetical protein
MSGRVIVGPSGFAGRYSRVIAGRYFGMLYCGALLRDVIAGRYRGAL